MLLEVRLIRPTLKLPMPQCASIGTVQRARPKQANYLARPIAVASRAAYYETLANGFSSLSSKATSRSSRRRKPSPSL
jgi:hypothetical protein